jgi:hypothetical protein
MDTPQESFYNEPPDETLAVLFRIISRHSWDELQSWQKALPGSRVEHLMHGLYVLTVEPGGSSSLTNTEEVDHVDHCPD